MKWTPKLLKVRDLLAQKYYRKEGTFRLVETVGLRPDKIIFDDEASNNWHNILAAAVSRRKFEMLLEICIKESGDAELEAAYNDYIAEVQQALPVNNVAPTDDLHNPPDDSNVLYNLPIQPKLIGRDDEIAKFSEILRQPEVRLLTLTGPSGAGKTALAKFLAVSLIEDFRDGVFLVELASISDPNVLPSEIGNTMPDYKQTVGVPLINFLRSKQRLLVLDNFETIITAAPFVTTLIEKCPQIKIIATSQQPLFMGDTHIVAWEVRRTVPLLSYPDVVDQQNITSVLEYPAIKLFITRAEAIKGDGTLELSPENVEAIVEICKEVNGLPLCIQIVASFISAYEPPQLLGFLREYGFNQLDQEKQLDAAIRIRFTNLEPGEQTLFKRLAVFVGWCSFEAVKEICGVIEQKQVAVIITLPRLVDKSFVQSENGMYQMLQVIRDYAQEQLEASSELIPLREKYAEYYLALVKKAEPKLKTPDKKEYLHQLEREYDNIRAVFDWSISPGGRLEIGLSMAGALFWHWNFLGYFREGRRQVQRVLNLAASQEPSEALASALYCDGGLAFLLGDYKDAQVQITKSVNMWRKIGSKSGLAYALIILGMVEKEIGKDYQLAYQHEEESAQLLESVGDQWGYALALNDLGNIIAAQGESHYAEARQQYEESRRKWELINDRWGLSLTLSNLSSLECKERNYNVAYNLMQAALEIQLEANDKWGRAWSLKGMGESKLGLQDFSSAASYFYESFCSHLGLGRKQLVAECLEGLAKVAAALEQPQRAAYLIGAADKLRDEAGSRMSDTVDKDYEDVLNYLRGDMSRKMFDKARAEGRAWDNERLRRNVNSFFSEWK